MSITRASLAAAINAVGPYEIFYGAINVAAGLLALGATEGDIEVTPRWENNDLTTERTGSAVHHRQAILGGCTITARVVDGDPLLWDKIDPLGAGNKGGSDTYKDVQEAHLLLVPDRYLPLAHPSGGAWSPAAAEPHLWAFWRATPIPGSFNYGRSDGGKRLLEVTFECMWDDTKIADNHIYSRGTQIKLATTPIV